MSNIWVISILFESGSRFDTIRDFRHQQNIRGNPNFTIKDTYDVCMHVAKGYYYAARDLKSADYNMILSNSEVWLDKKLSVFMVFRCKLYGPYKMEDLIGLARIWLGFGRLREIDYIIWKSGLSVSILWFLIEPDSSVFMFIHDLFADHISLSNSLPPFYSKTVWFLWNRVNPANMHDVEVLDLNGLGYSSGQHQLHLFGKMVIEVTQIEVHLERLSETRYSF